MAKHTTHKNTAEAKRATMERKVQAKRKRIAAQTYQNERALELLARELGSVVIA